MTAFGLLLDRCGLSHREAAAFLSVRPDTVKSWSAGRNPVPPGVIEALRTLYRRISAGACACLDQIDDLAAADGWPDEIVLGLAGDDAEALTLGWPCVGAHAAMLGLVAASTGYVVRVVPRGSEPATVAAIDARGRCG